jgi:fatty acid metabolism transcriptional regulator FadR
MEFESIKKVRVTEQIEEQIRSSIIRGTYKPGDRLPPERVLAKLFNVTRTTLREALKKLESLKLLTIRQGDGAMVGDYLNSESLDLLGDLLFSKDKVNGQILDNILEARKVFGIEMLKLALRKCGRKQIEDYENLVGEMEKSLHDAEKVQILDFEGFHILARATQNLVFVFILNSIKGIYLKHREFFLRIYDHPENVLNTHTAILEGMKKGRAQNALKIMEKYLESPGEKFKL